MSDTAALYREMFAEGGRVATIERKQPNGPTTTVPDVRVRITNAGVEEVSGGIKSTLRRVLVLAEDVPAAFSPLLQGDRVLVDGFRLTFDSRPDDQTHREGSLLLAYDGTTSGA